MWACQSSEEGVADIGVGCVRTLGWACHREGVSDLRDGRGVCVALHHVPPTHAREHLLVQIIHM